MSSERWEKTVEQAESVLETRVWNGHNYRYPLKFHIEVLPVLSNVKLKRVSGIVSVPDPSFQH